MSKESRHKFHASSVAMRRLFAAYSSLPDGLQKQIDQAADMAAKRVIEAEERAQGGPYPSAVFRCEIALERREQWHAYVMRECGEKIQQDLEERTGADGPEERLDWALERTVKTRDPGHRRPATLEEWLTRFKGPRGGEPVPVAPTNVKKPVEERPRFKDAPEKPEWESGRE